MRGFLSIVFTLVIVLMVYPFLFVGDDTGDELVGLPWQIEVLEDGSTRVFGLVPGRSTLADAVAVLGEDHEIGIITSDSGRDLEMYFGHYRVGLMSAKIVLGTDVADEVLDAWLQRAINVEHMETGRAKRFSLEQGDLASAMSKLVQSITFIPAVNLDDEIIRSRFGEPSRVIEAGAGLRHYLFRDKGLHIALHEDGKEVLQYVAPAEFDALIVPLVHEPVG